MIKLEVGQILENFINSDEGISVKINEGGIDFIITFNTPEEDEILAIKQGAIKVSYVRVDDVPMFTVKFEGLNVMDASYKFEGDSNILRDINAPNLGYAVNFTLIDSKNGKIKVLRTVGATNGFSKRLKSELKKLEVLDDWRGKVFQVQAKYHSDDIEKMSNLNFRI